MVAATGRRTSVAAYVRHTRCSWPSIVSAVAYEPPVQRMRRVRGRNVAAVGKPISAPFSRLFKDDCAVNHVGGPYSSAPGLIHPAFTDQPSNPRARDDEVLVADGIDLLGVRTRAGRRAMAAA